MLRQIITLNGITLALSKGRIFEETLPLLAAAGITPTDNPETSRKLIIGTNRPDVRLVIVRATDTPTYVQYGAADLGIAGKDVLIEHGGAGLYQPHQFLRGELGHGAQANGAQHHFADCLEEKEHEQPHGGDLSFGRQFRCRDHPEE